MIWVVLTLAIVFAFTVTNLLKEDKKAQSAAFDSSEKRRTPPKSWEDQVICEITYLPSPIKNELKNCSTLSKEFQLIGHDPILARLHRLEAVTILRRIPSGYVFVLTKQGMQVVRKRSRDLY